MGNSQAIRKSPQTKNRFPKKWENGYSKEKCYLGKLKNGARLAKSELLRWTGEEKTVEKHSKEDYSARRSRLFTFRKVIDAAGKDTKRE